MSRVLVVGDVMIDVVVRPLEELQHGSDTASAVHLGRGGSGANVAVALADEGHRVTYVGAAGDDDAARVFRSALHRAHVASELEVVDRPTGVVVSLVDPSGERSMLTDRGANARLSEAWALSFLPGHSHVHLSGYVVLEAATRELGRRLVAAARAAGISVSVDACSASPLARLGADVFVDAVDGADYLFANRAEAALLHAVSGRPLEERFGEVVYTLGADGAEVVTGRRRESVGAPAAVVVDTTGAGDAFTGAYLGARLRGQGVADALERAAHAASRVVSSLGA